MFARTAARLGGLKYQGPYLPGFGTIFAKLPKVPANLEGKPVMGNAVNAMPILLPTWTYWPLLSSAAAGLALGHTFFINFLMSRNPPNPPRSRSWDEKMRPEKHPHAPEDEDE